MVLFEEALINSFQNVSRPLWHVFKNEKVKASTWEHNAKETKESVYNVSGTHVFYE